MTRYVTLAGLMIATSLLLRSVDADRAATRAADDRAVRAVVDRFVDGLTRNDAARLHDAFDANAHHWFVGRSGALGTRTQAEWLRTVSANAGKPESVKVRIASVDVTNDVASVKVVEEWPSERYTDYLALVRTPGGWKVVNTAQTSETR